MAENQDGQERSEEATPKRKQEAAKKGQMPRSRELSSLMLMMGSAAALLTLGPGLLRNLAQHMSASLQPQPWMIMEPRAIVSVLGHALIDLLLMLLPLLLVFLVLAIFAPTLLGGVRISSESLAFKWDRLSVLKGIKRLFSKNALMELFKALAKFLVIGCCAVMVLWINEPKLSHLSALPILSALAHTAEFLAWIFLLLTLPLLLIAGIDVPFQLYQHAQQLRMTKQEVKDEMKDTEGRPEVKGRIRRLQQELAQRRMMEQVPQADVVITNPSHYAIALRYEQDRMAAPIVLAKGVDRIAIKIREIASSREIARVEAPLLARALYFNTELDQPIPGDLYLAVAQVLAYVYQLRSEDNLGTDPITMDVPVPSALRTE